MKSLIRKTTTALLLAALFLVIQHTATSTINAAENCEQFTCEAKKENATEYFSCLENKMQCLEGALQDISGKKATLNTTINTLSGKINLQELQINKTKAEIAVLESQIEHLRSRIDGLHVSLDRLTNMLVSRMSEQYKQSQQQNIPLLASANQFNDIVKNYRYIKQASFQTARAMQLAEQQRLVFDEQKALMEQKQTEVESKRKVLQNQQYSLIVQKTEQQHILSTTKNNEKRFQDLLAEAKKELAQIQNAASVVIRDGNAVAVAKGEVIGTMGNSGYSTGAHLHFSVYRYSLEEFNSIGEWGWYYSNHVDPISKLQSKTVLWDTGCGHDPSGNTASGTGDWLWPMSSPRITQSYGSNTCYNWMYGGKTHPALDMVSSEDISVRAVADGQAYFCRNCLGDGGNGVFIFHADDYMTVYWHLK